MAEPQKMEEKEITTKITKTDQPTTKQYTDEREISSEFLNIEGGQPELNSTNMNEMQNGIKSRITKTNQPTTKQDTDEREISSEVLNIEGGNQNLNITNVNEIQNEIKSRITKTNQPTTKTSHRWDTDQSQISSEVLNIEGGNPDCNITNMNETDGETKFWKNPIKSMKAFWNHPAGPLTIFFWAPAFKWALVIAGLSDLQRPAENLSILQTIALAATGIIWCRYSLVIIPKNYSLFSVNLFIAASQCYQLYRSIRYQYFTDKT